MSFNIPIPISELERIGTLSRENLFVTEVLENTTRVTKSLTWSAVLSQLSNFPDSIIFGFGSVELPSICFADSFSGFYSPQLGSVAVSTNHKERFAVRVNGLVEIGDPLAKDSTFTTIDSPTFAKCDVRFLENVKVVENITFHSVLQINSDVKFEDVTIRGEGNGSNLTIFGDGVIFGEDCNQNFDSHSPTTVYCEVDIKEDTVVKINLNNNSSKFETKLTTETLNVTQFTTLNRVNIAKNLIVDDGGRVDFDKNGHITTSGNIDVSGIISGDGQDITNLNIPGSLRLKGSIDPTTQGPGTPQHGDLWYSTTSGNFNNQWVALEGQPVTAGRSFYYFATPTPRWVLGAISDLASPFFMIVDLDQTVTSVKQHNKLINVQNTVDTSISGIVSKDLVLTSKGTSALTVVGDAANIITTKSYVDTRMTNATFDFKLKTSKYILGLNYDGAAPRTWDIEASPVGTDNLVRRNDEGNFGANVITATFLNGVTTDTARLDIFNFSLNNETFPLPFSRSTGLSKLIYRDSNLRHNPFTDTLFVDYVVADVTGDVTGNAATFTKFETTRTLWGRPFDATSDVVGDLINVGNITSDSSNTRDIGTGSNVFNDVYSTEFHGTVLGNVTVGDSTRQTLTNGDHIIDSPWNGSVDTTWNVQCTHLSEPNRIVVRDGIGDFAANKITANQFVGDLSGNVVGDISGSSTSVRGNTATTTKFRDARTLWEQTFNGTDNVVGDIKQVNDILPSEGSSFDLGSESLPYSTLLVDLITGDVENNSTSTDKLNNSLGRGNYIEGTFNQWNGRLADTWSIDPSAANVANKTVVRELDGSITARMITGTFVGPITGDVAGNVTGTSSSVTGNTATATKLKDAVLLWTQEFDGIGNVNGNILQTGNILPSEDNKYDLGESGVKFSDVYADTFHGFFQDNVTSVNQVTNTISTGNYIIGDSWDGSVDTTWNVFARSSNTPSCVVNRDSTGSLDASIITSDLSGELTGNVTGNITGSSGSVLGAAATATKLENDQLLISLSVTGTLTGQTTFQYIERPGTVIFDGLAQLEVELGNLSITRLDPLPE